MGSTPLDVYIIAHLLNLSHYFLVSSNITLKIYNHIIFKISSGGIKLLKVIGETNLFNTRCQVQHHEQDSVLT